MVFPAWGKRKWGSLHQNRLRNLFECILTKSDAWLFDSKWSSFFDNQSLDNQYHILSQSFSICCICVNSTILAFCLSTKINKMWYHFDIWVGTSQLSPNPFLFPTISLALSPTPICFEGNIHHISTLTFVDQINDCPSIRQWRWKWRRDDQYIWVEVVQLVRGIEENGIILSSASNGNDLANPFFPPNIRNFFDQTHFFNFSKHNQYAKPSAKAFDSFHPLVLIVGRSEKNAFEKCHLNKSEVAFLSKLTHNPKKFSTQLVCVLFKNGCSLFHIPGKSEHCFFTIFEDFSIMWRLDTLSLGIWGLHSCTKLVALHSHVQSMCIVVQIAFQ